MGQAPSHSVIAAPARHSQGYHIDHICYPAKWKFQEAKSKHNSPMAFKVHLTGTAATSALLTTDCWLTGWVAVPTCFTSDIPHELSWAPGKEGNGIVAISPHEPVTLMSKPP
uniref:Uncharacterized protein n=1 Tax=Sphaerodactylus townsendi TaxID=933632 RepID=A0ACB8GC56_9SAUR